MTRTQKLNKCTEGDYRELFVTWSEPLHWLCYTLTGDEGLSEKMLEAALEQSLKGADQVFRGWIVSWARRLIIKACIHSVQPWKSPLAHEPLPVLPLSAASLETNLDVALSLPARVLRESLLMQDALARFVFVLRAIEGYSRRDTSLLLNIDDRLCEWVYARTARTLNKNAESFETVNFISFVGENSCEAALAGD